MRFVDANALICSFDLEPGFGGWSTLDGLQHGLSY
jgi:hypothetical protein